MGHRDVKRVPLDFNWPLKKTWGGYLQPDELDEKPCHDCDKTGYSPMAKHLHGQWYGHVPFDPRSTGSSRLTADTPVVRAFAERNVSRSPDYYGTGEAQIVREAQRLAAYWNSCLSHHLSQADVDALVAADRLWDLTHDWSRESGWQPREPPVRPTAAQVNEWSIPGMGHDSTNAWVVIKARCEREGAPPECATCGGHGGLEAYPGQRADSEAWQPTEPPKGDGWQLWETTSEGSPVSPVFATAELLADWCADNATIFGDSKLAREEWLKMFHDNGTDVGSLLMSSGGRVDVIAKFEEDKPTT